MVALFAVTCILESGDHQTNTMREYEVSRQHEQIKSRIRAIANIGIAPGSTDVRETTSAHAGAKPGWAGGQQMMKYKNYESVTRGKAGPL